MLRAYFWAQKSLLTRLQGTIWDIGDIIWSATCKENIFPAILFYSLDSVLGFSAKCSLICKHHWASVSRFFQLYYLQWKSSRKAELLSVFLFPSSIPASIKLFSGSQDLSSCWNYYWVHKKGLNSELTYFFSMFLTFSSIHAWVCFSPFSCKLFSFISWHYDIIFVKATSSRTSFYWGKMGQRVFILKNMVKFT